MWLVQFTRKLTDVNHKPIVCVRYTRMFPERLEDLLTLVGPFIANQACEFISYCFPDIHPYKLILIVLRKFIVYCRLFLHFFHKERRVLLRVFCRHERINLNKKRAVSVIYNLCYCLSQVCNTLQSDHALYLRRCNINQEGTET